MSFSAALSLTTWAVAFASALQGLELLWMCHSTPLVKVWAGRSLAEELRVGLPLPVLFSRVLASDRSPVILAVLQILFAIMTVSFSAVLGLSGLFIAHLLICLRFRGSLNGGSDMMSFVVLTGAFVASWAPSPAVASLGLVYIAVHLIFSYFKAGLSKARHREWFDGRALPAFLGRSFYPGARRIGHLLEKHRPLSGVLGISLVVFEVLSPVALLKPAFLPLYASVAVTFHFAVFLIFGLNRFFWIWLSAWPSAFFVVGLIRQGGFFTA